MRVRLRQVRTPVAKHTQRTTSGIRFAARPTCGYSSEISLISVQTPVKPESIVKEMVVALGFRHKNKPVELRLLGNNIDTTCRRATFRFAVRWAKTPSCALVDDMRDGMRPLRPTSQAYAGDVDFIDIRLELIPPAASQEARVTE